MPNGSTTCAISKRVRGFWCAWSVWRRVTQGDVKPIDSGVSELRIHFGPGYRVYFTQRGQDIVILLAGGNKGSQPTDIQTALQLAKNLEK